MELPKYVNVLTEPMQNALGRLKSDWENIRPYSKVNQTERKVGRGELKSLVSSNVCEILFHRRTPERTSIPPRSEWRRMLCTNSIQILNSNDGKISLNFRFPKTAKRLDEIKHNIVVVWDIIMQDYRNVSMDDCYLIQTIPGDETFWKYYNEVLYTMSGPQKMNFMDT